MKSKKGFTLIELVVVMAIIAVLSLLIVAAIAAARRQSDLTAVTGDTKTYEIALESYAAKNSGKYPVLTTATRVNASGITTALGSYLSTTPGKDTIWYISDTNGAKYTLVGCSTSTTAIGTLTAGTVPASNPCTNGDQAYATVR